MAHFTLKRTCGVQAGTSINTSEKGTGYKSWNKTYSRKNDNVNVITYDDLVCKVLHDKDATLEWCYGYKLIADHRICERCSRSMSLVETNDRLDGLKWTCKQRINNKRHQTEISIRSNSWFSNSNMSFEEILKYTYWWALGVDQSVIMSQLQISSSTSVDWSMFCRETCLAIMSAKKTKLGGPGKIVEIDESKIGKRKYHRGHYVEGQWVFGGIERDSRNSFVVAVEDRSEKTLLPLIKEYITEGTTIISDCWKAYHNLPEHGYVHKTVNHSIEFKNSEGYHTNTIEGHWRHVKASLPSYSRKKSHQPSYLGEFLYRYQYPKENLFLHFIQDIATVYNPYS